MKRIPVDKVQLNKAENFILSPNKQAKNNIFNISIPANKLKKFNEFPVLLKKRRGGSKKKNFEANKIKNENSKPKINELKLKISHLENELLTAKNLGVDDKLRNELIEKLVNKNIKAQEIIQCVVCLEIKLDMYSCKKCECLLCATCLNSYIKVKSNINIPMSNYLLPIPVISCPKKCSSEIVFFKKNNIIRELMKESLIFVKCNRCKRIHIVDEDCSNNDKNNTLLLEEDNELNEFEKLKLKDKKNVEELEKMKKIISDKDMIIDDLLKKAKLDKGLLDYRFEKVSDCIVVNFFDEYISFIALKSSLILVYSLCKKQVKSVIEINNSKGDIEFGFHEINSLEVNNLTQDIKVFFSFYNLNNAF